MKKGRVSNQIRNLRQKSNLSQQELAEQVGATRQTINAIEQEKYSPSLELAFRLALVFNADFSDVFQFHPESRS